MADSAPVADAPEGAIVSELTGDYLEGTATFIPVETGGATLELAIHSPEGAHGVRLHVGTCAEPGEVWEHGVVGDIEVIGEGGHLGSGSMETTNEMWTVDDGAATDVVGKTMVIYGGEGESNGVMGCGVIGG